MGHKRHRVSGVLDFQRSGLEMDCDLDLGKLRRELSIQRFFGRCKKAIEEVASRTKITPPNRAEQYGDPAVLHRRIWSTLQLLILH